MFKKLALFASMIALFGLGAAAGCSDHANPGIEKFDAPAIPVPRDGGGDAPKMVVDPVDPGPGCYLPDNAASFDAATVVVAAQKGACTAAIVAEGKAACLGTSPSQAKCDAFKAANATCAGCLGIGAVNKDADGKSIIPALVPFGEMSVLPNSDACVAVALKNEATCGIAYVNETTCLLATCDTCASADLQSCANQSAEGACSAAVVDPNGACGKAYTDGKATADAACRGTGFDDTFAKVAAVLCQ